jgi:putative tryptophan/tyrosine transport system substrate-binding protein
MRRREFIAGLGGAAAWPIAARAQQPDRVRRIGVLMAYDEDDPAADIMAKTYLPKFTEGLSELGWIAGRNLRIDIRWANGGNIQRLLTRAKELIDLQPDVIFVESTPQTTALRQATQTIPIVFALVSDPIGSGLVASLSHPGGNITGFMHLEGSMAGKWLELLTDVAPSVKRAAAIFNPDTAPYARSYYVAPFEAAARSLKVEPLDADGTRFRVARYVEL